MKENTTHKMKIGKNSTKLEKVHCALTDLIWFISLGFIQSFHHGSLFKSREESKKREETKVNLKEKSWILLTYSAFRWKHLQCSVAVRVAFAD